MRYRIRKPAFNLLICFMSKTFEENDARQFYAKNSIQDKFKIDTWIHENYKEILSKTLSETYELINEEKDLLKFDHEFTQTCFHLIYHIFSIIPFRSLFITKFANDMIEILHQVASSNINKYFDVR